MPSPRKKELAEMMGKKCMRGGQPPGQPPGGRMANPTIAKNVRAYKMKQAIRKAYPGKLRGMRGGQPPGTRWQAAARNVNPPLTPPGGRMATYGGMTPPGGRLGRR